MKVRGLRAGPAPSPARCGRVRPGDEVAQLRVDGLAPAPSAEDAVVAGAFDGEAPLPCRRYARAQVQSGVRLILARDVVVLALDGQERGPRDRLGRDARAADRPKPARQQMLVEHDADRI